MITIVDSSNHHGKKENDGENNQSLAKSDLGSKSSMKTSKREVQPLRAGFTGIINPKNVQLPIITYYIRANQYPAKF